MGDRTRALRFGVPIALRGITPILTFPRQGGRNKKGRTVLLPDP